MFGRESIAHFKQGIVAFFESVFFVIEHKGLLLLSGSLTTVAIFILMLFVQIHHYFTWHHGSAKLYHLVHPWLSLLHATLDSLVLTVFFFAIMSRGYKIWFNIPYKNIQAFEAPLSHLRAFFFLVAVRVVSLIASARLPLGSIPWFIILANFLIFILLAAFIDKDRSIKDGCTRAWRGLVANIGFASGFYTAALCMLGILPFVLLTLLELVPVAELTALHHMIGYRLVQILCYVIILAFEIFAEVVYAIGGLRIIYGKVAKKPW